MKIHSKMLAALVPLLAAAALAGAWRRPAPNEPVANVDYDLSRLNPTMLYAQIYDMVCNPDNYEGKSVRMKGTYATFLDDSSPRRYHACFISDAAACCSQGVEFVATNAPSFPDDYPKVGTAITVDGLFGTYRQDGVRYAYIYNAVLSFKK